MNLLLWIAIAGALISLWLLVGYKYGWWSKPLFGFGSFVIGFSLVYLPYFPFKSDDRLTQAIYGFVFGALTYQAHRILVKYLYQRLEK